MHQLGMHDLAGAVLARARRRVGGYTDALASVMTQYQRQGQTAAAVEVAHQILRRSSFSSARAAELDDPTQRQAIQVLARAGKLQEMTDRIEAQLERSPQSLQLHRSLASFYRAAGRRDKLRAVSEAMIKLRPNDARLRMQTASQLLQSGDSATALEHFRIVLKTDPLAYRTNYIEVSNAFKQANRLDELARLFLETDPKAFGSPVPSLTLSNTLMQEPKLVDLGMALFRKVWEAFPNDHQLVLKNVNSSKAFWERPESYEYTKDAVIPASSMTRVDPWFGLDLLTAGTQPSNERMGATTTRLLDTSAQRKTLDDLAGEVETALGRHPRWLAGKAILAMIRIRQGRVDEGKTILDTLLADPSVKPTYAALIIVGQELIGDPALESTAMACFARAAIDPPALNYTTVDFQRSAVRQLASLYLRAGRRRRGAWADSQGGDRLSKPDLPEPRCLLPTAASLELGGRVPPRVRVPGRRAADL